VEHPTQVLVLDDGPLGDAVAAVEGAQSPTEEAASRGPRGRVIVRERGNVVVQRTVAGGDRVHQVLVPRTNRETSK
jgi:hypothetical protein